MIEMIPSSAAGLLHRSELPASEAATLKVETLSFPAASSPSPSEC